MTMGLLAADAHPLVMEQGPGVGGQTALAHRHALEQVAALPVVQRVAAQGALRRREDGLQVRTVEGIRGIFIIQHKLSLFRFSLSPKNTLKWNYLDVIIMVIFSISFERVYYTIRVISREFCRRTGNNLLLHAAVLW